MSLRHLSTIFLLLLFLGLPISGRPLIVYAGEYEDAKVAFGAFADGMYDFAGSELEQFLQNYPDSEMVPRVRLVLVLCSLETGSCGRAEELFAKVGKKVKFRDYKINPAELQFRIGKCFLKAGKQREARAVFAKIVKIFGKTDSAYRSRFELARIFFAEDKYVEVNRQLKPLLSGKKLSMAKVSGLDRRIILWMAAISQYQLGHYEKSLPLLAEISAEVKSFSLSESDKQDLYAVMIESSWHTRKSSVMLAALKNWLQIPEADLNFSRLASAAVLTADLLRSQKKLAAIRAELIKISRFPLKSDEKIVLYKLLVEIDSLQGKQKALKSWYKSLISLYSPGASYRVDSLEALLFIEYKLKNYTGVVNSSHKLLREKADFWQTENLYFPFITALEKLGKCREIIKYVPSRLPAYSDDGGVSEHQRRLVIDQLAGGCLLKLGHFEEAVIFYKRLYTHYKEPEIRIKLLALLCGLAEKTEDRKKLESWIGHEVMAQFSLDRREDEKLLRTSPKLVLLVAECLFNQKSYIKVLPALLWLEKLSLDGGDRDQVTFLLAEAFYRGDELAEARSRFEQLYTGNSKKFRYFAALRLVTIYAAQSDSLLVDKKRMKKLYQDLLRWESDPAVKAELRDKLKGLSK